MDFHKTAVLLAQWQEMVPAQQEQVLAEHSASLASSFLRSPSVYYSLAEPFALLILEKNDSWYLHRNFKKITAKQ